MYDTQIASGGAGRTLGDHLNKKERPMGETNEREGREKGERRKFY